MRRRVLAIVCTLALSGAAQRVRIDWTALENALAAYVATPAEGTARGVVALLPEAGRADLGEGAVDEATRERIFQQLGKIEPLLQSAAPGAGAVVLALRAISDGEFTRMLDEALGASLSSHAPDTLRALAGHPEVLGRGCRFASSTEPGGSVIATIAELDRRRSAVEAVSDADLRRARACVMLELERAIGAY